MYSMAQIRGINGNRTVSGDGLVGPATRPGRLLQSVRSVRPVTGLQDARISTSYQVTNRLNWQDKFSQYLACLHSSY
jgi:hypothetical protein